MSDTEPLEWTFSLGEIMPEKRRVVLGMALLAFGVGTFLLHNIILGVIGAVMLILGVAELFFPMKFRLDPAGATRKCGLSVTTIPWNSVLRVIEIADGVVLSPLAKPSRMSAFRGVSLRYSGNEEQVLAKIRKLWGQYGPTLEGTTESGERAGADHESGGPNRPSQDGGSGDAFSRDA